LETFSEDPFGKSNPRQTGQAKSARDSDFLLLFVAAKSNQKPLATIKLALYCCPELFSRPVFRDNIGLKQKLSQLRPSHAGLVGDF